MYYKKPHFKKSNINAAASDESKPQKKISKQNSVKKRSFLCQAVHDPCKFFYVKKQRNIKQNLTL